jgi:hypothetical protein
VLRTTVYAFASLLLVYLLATFLGSLLYRRHLAGGRVLATPRLVAGLAVAALLPVTLNDPRWSLGKASVFASIFPLCALLGYLTPKLIDEYSRGFARAAGRAYAVNVAGCILGPLAASYLVLPAMGARYGMALLAVPFLVFLLLQWRSPALGALSRRILGVASVGLLLVALFVNVSFEEGREIADAVVRRDHTATVISYGQGIGPRGKRLLVNGIGITHLNPITR